MSARNEKKQCFCERLESTMHDVEVILNQIIRLEAQDEYPGIDQDIKNKELTSCYCDLELSLAMMAIIIRKMTENQYIKISDEVRKDVNALIHSNRMDYHDEKVQVYSRQSQESVTLEHFLDLGKKILAQLD